MMTVNQLIELLQAVEDKDQEIYVNDRYGYHSTDIELTNWHHGDQYLIIDG